MLAIILANCVTLALATPGKPGFESTRLGKNLRISEYVWLGIFTLELLIRVIALGFIRGKGSYIRDSECAHGVGAEQGGAWVDWANGSALVRRWQTHVWRRRM